MSIIGTKNLGNAKKHNRQIVEHNRNRPTTQYTCLKYLHRAWVLDGRASILVNFHLHAFGNAVICFIFVVK